MTESEKRILAALDELTEPGGEMWVPFAPLEAHTGFGRQAVRNACRLLARCGFAEHFRGLMDEDGEPAGAGYCITARGRHVVRSTAGDHKQG